MRIAVNLMMLLPYVRNLHCKSQLGLCIGKLNGVAPIHTGERWQRISLDQFIEFEVIIIGLRSL